MFSAPVVVLVLVGTLSLTVGIATGGMTLAVSIAIAVFAFVLSQYVYRRDADEDRPARPAHGSTGIAAVLAARETGDTADGRRTVEATLRISIPGIRPYQVRVTDTMSSYAASRLAADAEFPCELDPDAPYEIAVNWERMIALEGADDPLNVLGVNTPVRTDASLSAADLLRAGRPGIARIVQSSSQGSLAPGGDPILLFVLYVVPDDGTPPFQALTAQRVPSEHLAKAASGTHVPVAYDPEKRTRMVAVDWAAAPPPDGSTPTTVMPARTVRRRSKPGTGRVFGPARRSR